MRFDDVGQSISSHHHHYQRQWVTHCSAIAFASERVECLLSTTAGRRRRLSSFWTLSEGSKRTTLPAPRHSLFEKDLIASEQTHIQAFPCVTMPLKCVCVRDKSESLLSHLRKKNMCTRNGLF